jgi:group II intron reverse transcriptase/maturase
VAHHIDVERLWPNLCRVPHHTAPGSDGQTADELKQDGAVWSEATLRVVHTQGYRPPPVRRTYIPKPGKPELRPLGVPCIGDRILQRCVADVLTAIYAQDFLPGSFGGRPGVGAHHALATLHEVIAGKPASWVYEADLRNVFGSLDHGWLRRFVPHRVGDPRLVSLIRRWLKAGVLEDGIIEPSDAGGPQGGNISVVLSHLSLHDVLDLWFERVVKPRLQGDADLIRYIEEFVVCVQHQADAPRFQQVLVKRLAKVALALEPSKTRLVAFRALGRTPGQAARDTPGDMHVAGLYPVLRAQPPGQLQGGMENGPGSTATQSGEPPSGAADDSARTAQRASHADQPDPAGPLCLLWHSHGIAGNLGSLLRVYRSVERSWRKMLSRRSQQGQVRWEVFFAIKRTYPLPRPKLSLPDARLKPYAGL